MASAASVRRMFLDYLGWDAIFFTPRVLTDHQPSVPRSSSEIPLSEKKTDVYRVKRTCRGVRVNDQHIRLGSRIRHILDLIRVR